MNEGIHLDLDTWIVPGQIRRIPFVIPFPIPFPIQLFFIIVSLSVVFLYIKAFLLILIPYRINVLL